MKEKIHCGLSSFGMSGRVFHRPLIDAHNGFDLVAAVEHTNKITGLLSDETLIYSSLDEMLAHPELELVIINVPDHLHYDFAKKTLNADKHVVVEKPFTMTTKQGLELIELAKEKKKEIFVFQNRRWDSDFLTVQKLIRSEKLGKVVEFEAHYDRYRPIPPTNTWKEDEKTGPGLLYNLGAHLIDQALVLFGRPESLFADLDIMRTDGKIIDYFNLILFYPKHRVILKSSYLAKEPAFKYMIQGEKGSYFKSGSDPQEERLDKGWKADDIKIGKEDEENWGTLFLADQDLPKKFPAENGNYLAFYEEVWKAIKGESNSAVKSSEGLEVIEIIEASIKSNKIGSKIKL